MSQEFKALVAEAKGIIGTAEGEGRNFTADEAKRVESLLAKAREVKLGDQLNDLIGVGSKDRAPATKLSVLVKDALRKIGAKDLTATPSLLVGVDFIGGPSPLQGVGGSRIFSVFPERRVSGGSVRYLQQRQVAAAVPAAQVAPGATKPTASWTVENVDADVPVHALISPYISNSVLRDGGADFERFVDVTLSADVYRSLDSAAYDALTAGAGNTQAYITSPQVSLRKAVTQLEMDGFEATHVFVNPASHETLALAVDAENRYYFGGPVESDVARVSGMKLVSSPAVDAGTAIVVAAPIAAIGVLREDVELAVDSLTHFDSNESRIRSELRALLAVTTPNAVVAVDVSA